MTPLSLETYANDVIRERTAAARHHALVAQARAARSASSAPRPANAALLATRSRVADALRSLARVLDPSIVVDARPGSAAASGEARLVVVARSR